MGNDLRTDSDTMHTFKKFFFTITIKNITGTLLFFYFTLYSPFEAIAKLIMIII